MLLNPSTRLLISHLRAAPLLRCALVGGALATTAIIPLANAQKAAQDIAAPRGRPLAATNKWVATWATSIQAAFTYAAPAPPTPPNTIGAASIQPDQTFPFSNTTVVNNVTYRTAVDQTFRTIIKPDLWGGTMRFRFNNFFGSAPVTFSKTTVALHAYSGHVEAGTMVPVTFNGGQSSVTVPVGQVLYSDAVTLPFNTADPLIQDRFLAVSYAVQGNSGLMGYHGSAFMTSYVTPPGSGDHTGDVDGFAYPYTTTSFFFLDSADVMAPSNTVVVCAFGDSITDGTHSTLAANDRWANNLSRRLHSVYGSSVSVVNEAISGNRVTGTPTAAGPSAVDRLDRDVIGLSGLSHVIWLEGINDFGGLATSDAVIAGYQNVVGRLHAINVKVIGCTLTSALSSGSGDGGRIVNNKRMVTNNYILTSGLYDGTADFDAATLDPATGDMKAAYLPSSTLTQLPLDYLHPNHAGYIAMGNSINLSYFAPVTQ